MTQATYGSAPGDRRLIVIGWFRTERRMVSDLGVVRIDLGERPRWEDVAVPTAAVWLLNGDERDMENAHRHARSLGLGAQVFAFPVGEADPLGLAKERLCTD